MTTNRIFIFSNPVFTFILTLIYGFALIALFFVIKLPFSYVFVFALAFPFAVLYLILPLNYSATIFLIFIFLNHYYLSPLIFPAAGLEIHPREIMLFMFIANFFVNLVMERVHWRWNIFLYFALMYLLFFTYIATLGFLSGYDWHRVVAETRFPIFALTAFIFPHAWKSLHSLEKTINILFLLSVIIALATYGLFIYVLITGKTFRFQNFMGEFVPARIGSLRLQEVRLNGHMLFELWIAVALSQILYFKERKKRLLYFIVLLFFIPPLFILMMKTALVSVLFACMLVVIIYLPTRLRLLASILFVLFVVSVFLLLALLFHLEIFSWTNSKLGISLQARLVEITGALENFMQSPLLGMGMGSQFVGMGLASNFWQDLYALATYQTLHNLWMYWLFKGGVIGFSIISIALSGIILASGYLITIRWTRQDKGFWIGYWACFVSQVIVMSLAFPRLSYPVGQVYLSFSIAIFSILYKELTSETSE